MHPTQVQPGVQLVHADTKSDEDPAVRGAHARGYATRPTLNEECMLAKQSAGGNSSEDRATATWPGKRPRGTQSKTTHKASNC